MSSHSNHANFLGYRTTLGERVRFARNHQRWSLDDLATRVGISRQGMWKIETDRSQPKLETLIAIAQALEIPLATLVEGLDELEDPEAVDLSGKGSVITRELVAA